MKIGLFTDTYTPEINGVVTSVVLLQKELEKHGHEVFVITTNNSLFEVEHVGNVIRLPGIEIKKMYGYVLTSPIHFSMSAKIQQLNLDIIHVHTEFGVGIFARIIAYRYNIPLVSTYHTTYEDYTHYVNPINLKSVDHVAKKIVANLSRLYGTTCVEMISPSLKTKEMLVGYGLKTPIEVIPTGIDLSKFNKNNFTAEQIQSVKDEVGLNKDEFLLVFVGRLAPEKSVDMPIRAMSILKKKNIKIKFLIVGSGPQLEELKELANQVDCQEEIVFLGKKPATDVPLYYHSSDAFVSASLTETQGLTYIEALASELPVFARYDDILENLVIDTETGFFFKNEEEFANRVIEYINYTDEEKNLIKKQCLSQVEKYDSEIFYQRVIALYERVVLTYNEYYEVVSVKGKNDYSEIIVENKDEVIKLLVDTKINISENIRLGSKLSVDTIEFLQEKEAVVKGYLSCIKKLALKDYTRKEMYDYLTQKTELNIGDINDVISILEERNYINDFRFTNEAIIKLRNLLQGEYKIFRTLKKRGISVSMIEEVSEQLKDEESELQNAIKAAEKFQSSINEVSLRKKKQKIVQKLFNQGFNNDMIEQVLSHLNYFYEEESELDTLRKIANKAKKRYSKQKSGVELRNMIFRYCSAQGFEIEDIYVILSEMEWENE